MKRLFLDDIRQPLDAFELLGYTIYKEKWDIVRNYNEFISYIKVNGLPEIISFDHDLAEEHYTPREYWTDYHASKQYQESKTYKEKTGKDCAHWLMKYCFESRQSLPKFLVHSANPVGRDNITYILKIGENTFSRDFKLD